MDKFFQKVRETKEQARRQEISNVASSNTHEAGWSGVAFIREWLEQHLPEGIPQFVVLPFLGILVILPEYFIRNKVM